MNTDKFTLFVYCNFLVLLSTTGWSQNINKQNVNIADETLTDYSFLSGYSHVFLDTLHDKRDNFSEHLTTNIGDVKLSTNEVYGKNGLRS